jgi:1-acyl-sn-glycerol-3-phosphate acyltransferase
MLIRNSIGKQYEVLPQEHRLSFSLVSWVGEIVRQLIVFPVIRLFAPYRVYGSEHLVGTGPYIFAVNHCSHVDTPLLLAALPLSLRLQVRVAAAQDYFFTSWWKSLLVQLVFNGFAFARRRPASLFSLLYASQLLQQGQSILIFPEGTRSCDQQLHTFKRGVGELALETAVPVVPVWLENTAAVFPKGAHFPHRHSVAVHFGMPHTFLRTSNASEVTSEIERAVRRLALRSL